MEPFFAAPFDESGANVAEKTATSTVRSLEVLIVLECAHGAARAPRVRCEPSTNMPSRVQISRASSYETESSIRSTGPRQLTG
jgi:hypothetical protein